MKKVKTVILSFIIIFASAFLTACTCSDPNVTQIYETGITIRCTSDNINSSLDAESGLLTINVHRGEEFTIEYTLAPDTTTTTQVDWQFTTDGIATPKRNVYTYSKSTVESITFDAVKKGTTTLVFTTKATSKKATAVINVYDAISQLPTFVAPEITNYNANNGLLTWTPTTQIIRPNGSVENADTVAGRPIGLDGYRVEITDVATGATSFVDVLTTNFSGLGKGKTLSIKITAIGNQMEVKSSEQSATFTFHHLATATDLQNNNGKISYLSPAHADYNVISYNAANPNHNINQTASATKIEFPYTNFGTNQLPLTQLDVKIKSFPKNYNADQLYALNDGIRYYPSDYTTTLVIKKLPTPTITLENIRQAITVGGNLFDDVSNLPHTSTRFNFSWGQGISYESIYGVQFAYQLVEGDTDKLSDQMSEFIPLNKDSYIQPENLEPGQWSLSLAVIGNSANTIQSVFKKISFNKLDVIKDTNWTIADNLITTSGNSSLIKGVELYFVNENTPANSEIVFAESNGTAITYDISKIGLASGSYKVYGKYVGLSTINANTATGKVNVGNEMDITVLNAVGSNGIASNGLITFDLVSGATSYDFIITHGLTGGGSSNNAIINVKSGDDSDNFKIVEGKGVIDFYELMKKALSSWDVINVGMTDEQVRKILDERITQNYTMTYGIIAKGDNSNVVASSPTRVVTLSRLIGVESTTLSDNNLLFSAVEGASNYIIEIDGKSSVNISNSTDPVSGKVKINLLTLTARKANSGDPTEFMYSYISSDKPTTIIVYAVGNGGNTNSNAKLDSIKAVITYNCTAQPADISLTESGMLSWQPMEIKAKLKEDESYDYDQWGNIQYEIVPKSNFEGDGYVIKFYSVVGSVYTELSEKLNFVPNEETTEYTIDINNILSNNAGSLLAIAIEEINSGKLNGRQSEFFYTIKLVVVETEKTMVGGNPGIMWDEVAGATKYIVTLIDGSGNQTLLDDSSATSYTIGDLDEGVYKIQVVASFDNNDDENTDTNPFILSSDNFVIEGGEKRPLVTIITVVNGQIALSAKGTDIVWANVCNGAEYVVMYKLKSESEYTSVPVGNALKFDGSIFIDEAYDVKVVPSVDYVEYGFIIKGVASENTIQRLKTADTLDTLDGKLSFRVYENDITGISIKLYRVQDGNNLTISEDLYTLSYTVIKEGEDFQYRLYTVALGGLEGGREHTLRVKVVAPAYLDSMLSAEKVVEKILTVSDIEKKGDWLEWSAVNNATGYEINYFKSGTTTPNVINLKVEFDDGTGSYICKVEVFDEDTSNFVVDPNVFKFENGKFYFLFDLAQFITDGSGDYQIKIKPLTYVTGCITGNMSASTIVTRLNNNVTATIDNGMLTISEYVTDSATNVLPQFIRVTIKGYEMQEVDEQQVKVYIAGREHTLTQIFDEQTLTIAPIDFNLITALQADGSYDVFIRYLGNDNEIISSIYDSEINAETPEQTVSGGVVKLEVTSLSTNKGVITWGATENATSYKVKITEGDEVVIFDVTVDAENPLLADQSYTYQALEMDEDEQVVVVEKTFTFEPNKLYEISIQGQASNHISSIWSAPFRVKKLVAPTNLNVTSDEKIQVGVDTEGNPVYTNIGEPKIKWSDTNVTSLVLNYELKYSDDIESTNIHNTGNLEGYILDKNLKVGSYGLQLRVIGSTSAGSGNIGLMSSDFSQQKSAEYIQDVQTPQINSSGALSWSAVTGAYAYRLRAYIKAEYDNPDITAGIQFEFYTNKTSVNFANTNIALLNDHWGYYVIEVNALTDPTKGIVSTNDEIVPTNTTYIYKPKTLNDYKVIDGMLSWSMNVSDIQDFVNGQVGSDGKNSLDLPEGEDNDSLKVIKFVMDKVNLNSASSQTLGNQLSFIYQVMLEVNGQVISDTPHGVVIKDSVGNIITNPANYLNAGNQMVFTYNVGIQPELFVDEQAGEPPFEYTSGLYNIRIASKGNTATAVNVASGGYSLPLKAYKPLTPRTWIDAEHDIINGNLLWGLVVLNSKLDTDGVTIINEFASKYRITASSTGESSEIVHVDVDIDPDNIYDGYKYSQSIRQLFAKEGGGYNITLNSSFRIVISAKGTADSDSLLDGERTYLNSNYYTFSNSVNILDIITPTVTESKLNLNISYGSTQTKVIIYGPFDNLNGDGSANPDWRNTNNDLLERVQYLNGENSDYAGSWDGYTDSKKNEIRALRHQLNLIEVDGVRVSEYTLTNNLLNGNSIYAPGGYVIHSQEIGDGKGIVDSPISTEVLAQKLATTTSRVAGAWLGGEGSPENAGQFVWNAVPLANGYEIKFYETSETGEGEATLLATDRTRNTYYEAPSDFRYNSSAKKYFIEIIAIHTSISDINVLSNNYFSGDTVTTNSYQRIDIPHSITITGDGVISWNELIKWENTSQFALRFTANEEIIYITYDNNATIPTIDLGSVAYGSVNIEIRAIAYAGGEYINSSYSIPIVITKLADPITRVEDGVFNWGTQGDGISGGTVMPPELIINGQSQEIDRETTSYKLYTELDTYNSSYNVDNDNNLFAPIQYDFKVKFKGSEGQVSSSGGAIEDFYIASLYKTFTATKLYNPIPKNVELDFGSGYNENRIQWQEINNANGYKVLIFNKVSVGVYNTYEYILTKTETGYNIKIITNKNIENADSFDFDSIDGLLESDYFAIRMDEGIKLIDFRLNHIISKLGGASGLSIHVHVQALGSSNMYTSPAYLSSSYSNALTIAIPPAPILSDNSFDETTGKLSWAMDSDSEFNIILKTEYVVNNVTLDEYNNYWKLTADVINGVDNVKKIISYSEIKHRIITHTQVGALYKLEIIDTILLLNSDYDNKTPTSYSVTSVGANYYFALTATTYSTVGGGDGTYTSATVTKATVNNKAFALFAGGDGSSYLPYRISNSFSLKKIEHFKSRNFILVDNINLELESGESDTWKLIKGNFSGTIDGNGKTISNIIVTLTTNSPTAIAMFEQVSGTIQNVNLEVKYAVTSGNYNIIKMAGLAITNDGIISNVHIIAGSILEVTNVGITVNTEVSGLVNQNNGTITSSSVTATIKGLDNGDASTFVNGISKLNGTYENHSAVISKTFFNGTITGNNVSGIVYANYATIDRCYSDGIIHSTDRQSKTETTTYKGSFSAGIASMLYEYGSITNSYTLSKIVVTKANSSNATVIGAIVAIIESNKSDMTISNCYAAIHFDESDDDNISLNGLTVYAMCPNNSLITIKDNYYYLVETPEIISITTNTNAGVTNSNNLTTLRNNLAVLSDENGNIYNLGADGTHPTLKY